MRGYDDKIWTGDLHALRIHPEPLWDVRPAGMQFEPSDTSSPIF